MGLKDRIKREAEALKTAKRVLSKPVDKETAMQQYDFELWKQRELCKKFINTTNNEDDRQFIFKYKFYIDSLSNLYASIKKLENEKEKMDFLRYQKKKYNIGKQITRTTKKMNREFRNHKDRLNKCLDSVNTKGSAS